MDDIADKYLPILKQLENSKPDAVSPKGAIGTYQIMPTTGAAFGYTPEDLKDPVKNEDAARKTVRDLVGRVGDDPDSVLTGYNAGTKALNAFRAAGRDLAALPAETQKYLTKGRSLFAAAAPKAPAATPQTTTNIAQLQDTMPTVPNFAPTGAPFEEKLSKAIAAGYSQDEINQYVSGEKAKAKAAGYSDDEISKYFGTVGGQPYPYATGNSVIDYFGKELYDHVTSAYNQIKTDWQKARTEDEAAQHDPTWWGAHQHLFYSFLADGKLPVDAFQAALSPIGAALDAVYTNPVANAMHFVQPGIPLDEQKRQVAQTLWGLSGEGGLVKAGEPAMSAATFPELVAGRVALATQKTGSATAVAGTEHITTNLEAMSVRTGESVPSLTERAQTDPVLREQLVGKFPPKPPEGSSHTPTPEGDFVIPKDETVFAPQTPKENQAALAKFEQMKPDEPRTTGQALDNIGAHIAQPIRPGFNVHDFGERLYEELFDDQAPWKRLIDAARDGKPMPSEFATDPVVLQRLATGSKGRAKYSLEVAQVDMNGTIQGPSFKDIMKPVSNGTDFTNFERYITAVRAEDWHAKRLDTGLDPADTAQVAGDAALKAQYDPVLKGLVQYRNNELAMMSDAGLISSDGVKKLIADEPYPIPFHRAIEGVKQKSGATGTVYQPVKAATGSERRILGPVEQIMRESIIRHDLAAHNIANDSVVSELEPAGFAFEKSKPMAINLTPEEINDIAARAGGQDVDGFDATIFRHFKFPVTDTELPVFRNGTAKIFGFTDPEAAKALRGMGRQAPAIFTKIMAGIARVQRASIVLNPAFPLRQILYDIPFQFTISDGVRNSLGEFLSGMYHGIANTPMNDLYKRSGAWRPLFDDIGDKYIRNQVAERYGQNGLLAGIRNTINTPFRALKGWSDLIYSAQRRGRFVAETKAGQGSAGQIEDIGQQAFDAAKAKRGGTQEKAQQASLDAMRSARQAQSDNVAREAMKATFHTDEKGSFSRVVNQGQLFFSAFMNMMKRTADAFNPTDPAKFAGSMAKAVAVYTVPALLNHYAYKDEPWYKETPEFVKDMGLIFPPLHEGGYPLFIPQSPLFRLLFGGIPRRIAEMHEGTGGFKDFIPSLLKEAIPFQATYNAALPIIENIANYSFYRGEPLYTGPKTSAQYQFTSYTSPAAKAIARTLSDIPLLKNFDLKPWQIDNMIQQAGPLIQGGVNAVASAVLPADKNQAPEKPLEDNIWTGAFFSRYPSASAASIQNFYQADQQFQTKHADIEKALTDNDMDTFRKLVAENPIAASTKYRPKDKPADLPQYLQLLAQNRQAGLVPSLNGLRRVRQEMSNLRDTEHKIIHDPTIDAPQKRQLLDQVYGSMIVDAKLGSTILGALGE